MRRTHLALAVGLLGLAAATGRAADEPAAAGASWETLEPGLELGTFVAPRPADVGDSVVRVLRIDPRRFALRLLAASAADGLARTAREWCSREGTVAAINASMYQTDHRTSVSFMRTGDHTNNPRVSKDKAFLAFGRRDDDVPHVKIIDRDCDPLEEWLDRHDTVVQSIRMLSCTGRNVWTQQPRRWSTAAIGTDGAGRVLFIHVRSPYSTHDVIEILRALPLDLARAMYAEGGPEAQLYVRSGEREHEFVGSHEALFVEDARNQMAWPVPNVVAVVRRTPAPARSEGGN